MTDSPHCPDKRPNVQRLWALALVVACLAGGIGWRLFQLQVAHRDVLRARANNQHVKRVEVPATRGAIVDRNGVELAVSLDTDSLYAHPHRVTDARAAAKALAPLLGKSRGQLLSRLQSDKRFVWLGRFLDPDTAASVRALDLNADSPRAFGLLPEPRRHYPRGTLAAHVVGYATIDGEGVAGIEGRYDDELAGLPTSYLVQQDGRNRRVRLPVPQSVKQPRDIVLSIDTVLQHIVERELVHAVESTGARAASAVLLDPATGQILALANYPVADPNHWGRASHQQRVNRAIVHFYEPGSTFKMIPMSAALELETVSLRERFHCENGIYKLGARRIKDISPNGLLTPPEILAESSNIGMVKIASTLEPRSLSQYIRAYGFGQKTGIELPGESPGLYRHESRWSDFTQASLSFGQEIGVTVLQMASAIGSIAYDGVIVPPRVVLGTRSADGEMRPAPKTKPRRVIDPITAERIRIMMEGVVEDGTGARAAVPGYRIAGKSGTAQIAVDGKYSETDYMASFGGFGPAHDPRVVGLVVLDSPRGEWIHGGQVAAPVFAEIMGAALRHLRAPYDDPPIFVERGRPDEALVASASSRSNTLARPVRSGVVPELYGLGIREALVRLNASQMTCQIRGKGVVLRQYPAAGTQLTVGEPCRLVLGEPARLAGSGAGQ